MKLKHSKALAALAIISAFCTQPAHALVDLSSLGYVTYGDANSYSLPISGLEIMAGPGQIDLYTKLGLQSQLSNGTPGMDNAFDTPSANNVDGFRMTNSNEPGGALNVADTWDRLKWWDTSLQALNTKINLSADALVFFFANNETGNGDNLAGWARVELTRWDSAQNKEVLVSRYDMTNDADNNGTGGYGPPPVGGGIPLGNVANYTSDGLDPGVADFLMSGGEVCVAFNGALLDCDTAPAADIAARYQHNLGGDRAAYAIVFPELNADIASIVSAGGNLSEYALHVDYRLGCGPEGAFPQVPAGGNKTECDPDYAINGGSEKVFIGSLASLRFIPEPSSMVLAGLGLLGLSRVRRNRA